MFTRIVGFLRLYVKVKTIYSGLTTDLSNMIEFTGSYHVLRVKRCVNGRGLWYFEKLKTGLLFNTFNDDENNFILSLTSTKSNQRISV